MSIFPRLFGSSTEREINDPVFGRLVSEKAVWTGRAHVGGESFEIFVIAGNEGPSATQRAFFETTVGRLSGLIDTAQHFVREQTHNASLAELQLYAIEVGPDAEVAEHRFTMELSTIADHEIHRVEFKGSEAVSYSCDD